MNKSICLFLIAAIAMVMTSCHDDDNNTFQSPVGTEAFSFEPIAGGAVMRFQMPSDNDITSLNVRYKDFKGDDILRTASVMTDSLLLIGFNEAKQDVPALVTFCKRNGTESDPVSVKFSTLDSAPVSFFDRVKVMSGWNGFSVITDNPTGATGIAHVFYLGKDPISGDPDTLLLSSFRLTEGKDTLVFEPKQQNSVNTIVIRTEDFRGYMVKEKVWTDIASYTTGMLDASEFDFYSDKSVEDDEYKLGAKYLFDGDKNGESYFINVSSPPFYTYLAGPNAVGAPMYVDMRENKITAQVRLYAMVNNAARYYLDIISPYREIWHNMMIDKLPCDVEVFGAKDDGKGHADWDNKTWVRLGGFSQNCDTEPVLRWSAYCQGDSYARDAARSYRDKKQVMEGTPIFMKVGFSADGQDGGYRYLKIVVNDVFNHPYINMNIAEYVTFNEMEIYTQK